MTTEISEQILEIVARTEDHDVYGEVYTKLVEQERSHLTEIKEMRIEFDDDLEKHVSQIISLKNKNKKHLDDIDLQYKKLDIAKDAINNLTMFRQSLNILFNSLWNRYESIIQQLNPDWNNLSNQTVQLKRKQLILNSNGLKLAVLILNDQLSCQIISKKLCNTYICMNDSFHPKTKPVKIVYDMINKLKELLNSGCISLKYLNTGLNIELLDEFKTQVDNNINLFTDP